MISHNFGKGSARHDAPTGPEVQNPPVSYAALIITIVCLFSVVALPIGLLLLSNLDAIRKED